MERTVDSFMETLQSMSLTTQKKKPQANRKVIEKLFCNFAGNFGKYQILPFNNVITNFPYVILKNTREINIPRRNMGADGKETVYNAWIRLLPESAYTVKDPSSGKEVSSLTAAEESLLHQAYNIFEELYKEVDARNNAMDPTIGKLIRRKNYTLFHGYCINKWEEGDSRNPVRSNFSALFVVTAKNFIDFVNNSIADINVMENREDWYADIYNSETSNRSGFLMFSIGKSDSPGFSINVHHQLNAEKFLAGVNISEEEAYCMQNPVESFLGWQANAEDGDVPSDQRRLFNKKLTEEAINFMTEQLARIRMAKQNGASVQEAINATNEMVIKGQNPTNKRGVETNDPVLAEMANVQQQPSDMVTTNNPESVMAKNDSPFQTPPAAKLDPVSGTPVGTVTGTMNQYTTEQKVEEKNPFNPSFGGMNFGGNKPF